MTFDFDDDITGISYQQYPKDPQAREQILILDNKVEQLKEKTVSKQEIIDIESKVRQSDLDKENFKIFINKELTNVKNVVEGIDGGNVEKIAELETAVNLKANKDVVDSLLNQIEGSVKQINGNAPDENGNVIIDVKTEGLATVEEVTTKTDELAGLIFSKAEKADVESLVSQVSSKASAQSVTQISSQLADTLTDIDNRGIDIKKFGVVGDGITNDTVAIQTALNSGRKIFWSKGTYYFTQIFINNDNTHILFDNNVILKSDYKGNALTLGAIEIKGVRGTSYGITQDITEGTTKISVANVSPFTAGDFVKLEQTNPAGTDLSSHRQKWLHCLLTIKSIDSATNTLTVNEAIPHSFQIANSAIVVKITPIKNTTIIGNNTVFDKMGTTEYANHFYVNYAYNLNIRGFETENGGGKGITIYNSHTFDVRDIVHRKPTAVTEGKGYGVQIISGSGYGIIDNVRCYDSRHAIDFSSGAHDCTVTNSYGFNSNFNGHGMNAKAIRFDNCHCYGAGFGIGNYSFLSDENWKFVNCTTTNAIDGFGVHAESFNTEFVNCEAINCTNGYLLNTGSKGIEFTNVKAVNSANHGFSIRCSDVSGSGVTSTKSVQRGINFSHGLSNVNLSNVSVTDGGVYGIGFEGACNAIALDAVKLRGTMNRGLLFSGDSFGITVDKLDADLTGTVRVIEISSSNTIDNLDITISNSPKIKTTGTYSIFCNKGGVKMINNNILNNVQLEDSPKGYIFQNNKLGNISVLVKSLKNTMISGNYGSPTTWTVPTDNGTNVIVKDNITTMI